MNRKSLKGGRRRQSVIWEMGPEDVLGYLVLYINLPMHLSFCELR